MPRAGLIGVLLVACSPPPGNFVEPPTRPIRSNDLGLKFEVPKGWISTQEGAALVVSGPPGTNTFHTTVTLQWVTGVPAQGTLGTALHAAYEPASKMPGFEWLGTEPTTVGGLPGLRYSMRFELHETPRFKAGALVAAGPGFVDISYGAPENMFANGIVEFEGLLASLHVLQ